MKKEFHINQIHAIAKEVLEKAKNSISSSATIVALSGDLGAGKTTLTQAMGRELGVKESIISPTFVIMKIYELKKQTWKHFIHIDAYRLDSAEELEKLGWNNIISDSENLVLIEWPERVQKIISSTALKIKLEHINEEERKITI